MNIKINLTPILIELLIAPMLGFCASEHSQALRLKDEPIVLDRTLSFYEVLTRQEQYIGDVMRMGEAAESLEVLSKNYLHEAHLTDDNTTTMILTYLATMCSSQLGRYCEKFRNREIHFDAHEKDAFMRLIQRSKAAVATLAEETRDMLRLSECQYYKCAASRYRFPATRESTASVIAKEHASRTSGSPQTCCFFASGFLAHELEILKALAHTKVSLKKIILIDPRYSGLITTLGETGTGSLNIMRYAWLRPNVEKLQDISSKYKSTSYAWLAVQGMLSTARAVEHFNNSAHSIFPELESIVIYGTAKTYIEACSIDPLAQADALIGCDFKEPCSKEFGNGPWKEIWCGFQELQRTGIKPSGAAYRLTTSTSSHATLTMSTASTTKEWHYDHTTS